MKTFILTLLFSCLAAFSYGQDVIIKLSGEEVPAKVEEITLQEILYKHPDSLQGSTWRMAKAEVFMIRFANGTREVFQGNLTGSQAQQEPALNSDQLYQKGRNDARLYYKGNEALWASAGLTLVAPFTAGISLAGPVAIAAIPPKIGHDPVLDNQLLNDPDYVRGYKKQAHRRKAGKAAAGVGLGAVAIQAVLILMLSVAFGN